MTRTASPRHFYHGNPYRRNNSYAGGLDALRHDYDWIDWDAQESCEQTLYNTHWGWLYKDRFESKTGGPLLRKGRRRVKSLKNHQLDVVESTDGYKMHQYTDMMRWAAKRGLNIECELKVAASRKALTQILTIYKTLKTQYSEWKMEIKILLGVLSMRKAVKTFRLIKEICKELGIHITTMLLNHDKNPVQITPYREQYIDRVRGKWIKAA